MALEVLGLPWWYYLLGVIGAGILGALFAAIGFWIFSVHQSYSLRKGTPFQISLWQSFKQSITMKNKIDKSKISEWLNQEDTRNKLNYPGLPTEMDKKEVAELERRERETYREFDKLRREARKRESSSKGNDKPSEQPVLPIVNNTEPESDFGGDEQSESDFKFD